MVFGMVRGAEHAATAAGFTLVIAESQESGEAESTVIEQIMPSVDGVVLATTRLAPEAIADIADRKPVVLINREVDGVASVVSDVEVGVRQLVEHLHGLGHRSIAYLSGPPTSWISDRRWEHLLDVAEEPRPRRRRDRAESPRPSTAGGRPSVACWPRGRPPWWRSTTSWRSAS